MLRPLGFPLWFGLLVAVAWAALTHTLGLHALERLDVQLAFWGWIIPVATAIWQGLQAVGQITLAFLQWAVDALWVFAKATYNGLIGLGQDVLGGFHKAWGFLKGLYVDLLKPAWLKFWRLVDTVGNWLDKTFGPLVRFLRSVRTWILDFYKDYLRPILDAIDVTQKILGLLERLGVRWAGKISGYLQRFEDFVNEQFGFVLRQLNTVINFLDEHFTKEGLLQRLTLLRSIERDIAYVAAAFWNAQAKGISAEEKDAAAAREYPRLEAPLLGKELGLFYRERGGELEPIIMELVPLYRGAAALTLPE